MARGILDGIRVVDLSDDIAGPAATLLLAEVGADVVMVEPPAGRTNRELSGFLTWGRSKRSVVADLHTDAGRATLEGLLATADVLVHDMVPSVAAAHGLDDESLATRFPDLVVTSVLSWPANHADAELPVDELLALARLGVLDEQMGYRDGPVLLRFPMGSWGATYLAVTGIVARLIARGRTGRAGPVHTSLVQGALAPMMMHWSRADTPSESLAVGMPKHNTQATLYECGDGVWVHSMGNPLASPLMQQVLGELGVEIEAPEGSSARGTLVGVDVVPQAFLRRTSRQWLDDMWANDIPVQPALPPGEIFHDEQSRVNDYVLEYDDRDQGRVLVAGLPLTVDPPAAVQGPAPRLGEHTDAVVQEWARPANAPRAVPTRDSLATPLDGVRVIDFGNFLAGPFAPMLLADLGADVVKVESTTGDNMRFVEWAFAGCQRGKRSVALDLKSPATRPAIEALVRGADIVHHNVRMPAARRLGLDYDTLRAIKPDLVYCHASSYGPRGPRADWPGYDQLFQSSCGWEVAGAGEGNPPMWHRLGFTDHLCAMSSLVATLLALYRRDLTGEGQFVAGSLLGAGVMTCSETYVDPSGKLAPMPVLDHAQARLAPGREIFAVADGWVALAARTDAHLAALCELAGVDHPADAASALGDRTVADVLAACSAAGVPAEQVRLAQRDAFFDSAANQAARLVTAYPHRQWGRFEQPGSLVTFGDDLGTRTVLAPPVLGEHTVEVLTEVGFSRADVDALVAAGAAVAR